MSAHDRKRNQCIFCNVILGQVTLSPTGLHLLHCNRVKTWIILKFVWTPLWFKIECWHVVCFWVQKNPPKAVIMDHIPYVKLLTQALISVWNLTCYICNNFQPTSNSLTPPQVNYSLLNFSSLQYWIKPHFPAPRTKNILLSNSTQDVITKSTTLLTVLAILLKRQVRCHA